MSETLIKVGVGACTVGNPVRYNGEAKKRHHFIDKLGEHVKLVSFCPEVGIGLGVPRETIRLVDSDQGQRAMDSDSHSKDFTQQLIEFADKTVAQNPDLAGYILVKNSPSCGMTRMKLYKQNGDLLDHSGVGIFARRLMELLPNLPVEEDGRLNDGPLRESFAARVYVYQDWLETKASGLTPDALVKFYARYKYMLMAHHVPTYKKLGPLLADAGKRDPQTLGEEMISLIMQALKKPVTRKGYTNALQHLRGYLKRDLAADEKQDIDRAIEQYRQGIVPLIVPMNLLQYQFNRHPNEYIAGQVIMQPYPEELGLRNTI
ncbi:MAG: YbgA family protein [Pseudomonadales bacterium]